MRRREFLEGVVAAGFVSVLAYGGMAHPASTKERLVVEGRSIRLEKDIVFDRNTFFVNCSFSGVGSFVIPGEFNNKQSGFHSCRFDYRGRPESGRPWIVAQ